MSNKRKRRATFSPDLPSPTIAKDASYTDFLCPICLQILIEPVQMPCQHELCMQCFKMHVENTSLLCPMCRLRISTWVRRSAKNNTLINLERWELIKSLFPERVRRRLNGDDDFDTSYNSYNAPKHIIAAEGELRKEYEEELKKIKDERDTIAQANVEYIKQLEVEDRMTQKQQEEMDEAQAKALQEEEMRNLGVTLKSPSAHQRQLLAIYKPKSPMRLRGNRSVLANNLNHRRKINLLSPNSKITNFFSTEMLSSTPKSNSNTSSEKLKSLSSRIDDRFPSLTEEPLTQKISQQTLSTTTTIPVVSSNRESTERVVATDNDFELAVALQKEFDEELSMKPVASTKRQKRPFTKHNSSLSPPKHAICKDKLKSTASTRQKRKQENVDHE